MIRKAPFIAVAAGCAALLAGARATAQDPATQAPSPPDLPDGVTALGPVVAERSDRYRLESAIVGEPFVIDVTRVDAPFSPPAADARLPVVFVTDGNLLSMLAVGVAQVGAMELLPSMILVGIGHDLAAAESPAEAFVLAAARRATDFTPIFDEAYLAAVVPFTEQVLGQTWPEDAPLGGANTFLDFIERELKPFIAARYPANGEDTTLLGHSLGGLFTLHVLFTSPRSFARYVALSPAANYGDEVLFREEAALGDVSARLFIGVASEDSPEILASAPRLHAAIEARARPGLRYRYELFQGETHSSILPGGLLRGLRAVFDPPPPPAFGPSVDAQP